MFIKMLNKEKFAIIENRIVLLIKEWMYHSKRREERKTL